MNHKLLEITARHEAAHAVAAYLVYMPATSLSANSDGTGLCEGSNDCLDAQASLRIALAGPASDLNFKYRRLHFLECCALTSPGSDMWQAREILSARIDLRLKLRNGKIKQLDVYDGVSMHLEKTCAMLLPFVPYIEKLGSKLAESRWLSAKQVESWLVDNLNPVVDSLEDRLHAVHGRRGDFIATRELRPKRKRAA